MKVLFDCIYYVCTSTEIFVIKRLFTMKFLGTKKINGFFHYEKTNGFIKLVTNPVFKCYKTLNATDYRMLDYTCLPKIVM